MQQQSRTKLRITVDSFAAMSSSERSVTIILVTIALLVGYGVVNLTPLDLTWKLGLFGVFIVGLGRVITLLVHRYAVHRQGGELADSSEAYQGLPPDAHSLPPVPDRPPKSASAPPGGAYIEETVSKDKPPRRFGRQRYDHRELVEQHGVKWLVIHTYKPIPQGRFKKPLWKHKIQRLELDNSSDVVARFATKVRFSPTEGEKKIYWLDRLHWWSHGPAQLGILILGLLILGLTLSVGLPSGGVVETAIVASIIVLSFAIWFFFTRIHWSYKYLMLTNAKIRLHYVPPFKLARSIPQTNLNELKGGINPKASMWANLFGYGTVKTETVAGHVDDWLLNDVKYVKHYERFAALMDQLRENMENAFRQPDDI